MTKSLHLLGILRFCLLINFNPQNMWITFLNITIIDDRRDIRHKRNFKKIIDLQFIGEQWQLGFLINNLCCYERLNPYLRLQDFVSKI